MEQLGEEVRQVQLRHPQLTEDNAFCFWFTHAYLTEDEHQALLAICGRSGDVGLDCLFIDEDAKHVYLVQAKYHTAAKAPSESRNDVLDLGQLGLDLVGDDDQFATRLSNAYETVQERLKFARRKICKDSYRLRLSYATKGTVSEGIADEAEHRTKDIADYLNIANKDDLKTVEAPAVRIAFAAWRKWWKERQGRLK
jgi:hypothetical protein